MAHHAYAATVSDADLALIDAAVSDNLHRWGIAPDARVTLLNHSENTTYRIDQGGRRHVLRVHRLGYHRREAIAMELDWVRAIARDTSIRTALPVAGRDGELIQDFATAAQPRHAVLFEFLDGEQPREDADLTASFERLGEITAVLHEHSRRWDRGRERPLRPVWDFEHTLGRSPIWGEWRRGIGVTGEVAALLQQAVDRIEQALRRYGRSPERFGLVHADLRLANLLLHGDEVGVIDFDDCGYSWYMYDLGSALSFIEHTPQVPALIDAWVRGYGKVRPLGEEELAMIPSFVMLRRILLVAWLGSHDETDLAKEIGREFTPQTCEMATRYLAGSLFA